MRRVFFALAWLFVVAVLPDSVTPTAAATCVSTVGPGISPPASVPRGMPGFHAVWFGQSGYMTLCPGEVRTATVAYYNSGSAGWVAGRFGETAYLGTSGPEPGQDRPSQLGGDGTAGSPNTGWPRYNRLAMQPSSYVGPGQVAWFQFAVRAPMTPGTYRIALRPLIEGTQWMEDYGVFWVVNVPNALTGVVPVPVPTPQPTPTATPFSFVPPPQPPVGTVIRTCIAGEFTGWSGETAFDLCNGQVWVQSSFAYTYRYVYRPNVTIVKTTFAWTMAVDGMTQTIAVAPVNSYVRSCISGDYDGWSGDTVFVLCNGQIWQQVAYGYNYDYGYRPRVLIYERPFGGYLMQVEGESETVRVARVR